MTVHTLSNGVDERPYVGIRPFRAEDGNRFFGRSTESRDLAERWRANRLTVLYGASGVGKTSLLLAGPSQQQRGLPNPGGPVEHGEPVRPPALGEVA